MSSLITISPFARRAAKQQQIIISATTTGARWFMPRRFSRRSPRSSRYLRVRNSAAFFAGRLRPTGPSRKNCPSRRRRAAKKPGNFDSCFSRGSFQPWRSPGSSNTPTPLIWISMKVPGVYHRVCAAQSAGIANPTAFCNANSDTPPSLSGSDRTVSSTSSARM